jgi:hypothetical protein
MSKGKVKVRVKGAEGKKLKLDKLKAEIRGG